VGCSTGEEAYSIAILLREHMARIEDAPQIQIFASDLDGRALAAARAGRYPDTIAPQMTPERLGRWFVKEGNTYHIAKELREMCIFSQHSIIKDAPFSRIDLISCRNLLIYLDADLQTQVIPLFHFALRSGGVLFLGNSENVSRHAALFSAVESRSRIFSRIETATRALPSFPFTSVDRRLLSQPVFVPATESPRADSGDLARKAQQVAERYAPAYAVLDHAYTVLQFSGRTGRFLDPAGGVASLNFLQLVHSSLRLDLRAALARATEEDRSVTLTGLSVESGGHQLSVDIVVEPIRESSSTALGFMVLFRDSAVRPDSETPQKSRLHESEHTQRLEDELQLTKARLQGTIEELESTNEELKSSNEEYQSLNEELQSANEELETSKEELQSINEELTTVNGELAHRVQELGRANSDLKNFLESTQIATLFLDNDLRVTNFTPTIVEVFHLIESDLGRPIGHLRPRVAYDELQDDVRRVLRTLQPVEREIDNPATGARHMVRVLPYRSTDNFIAGVVITFVDMTARRQAEERLRESEERFRAIVETARDYAIFTTDPEGRIMIWPAGASQIFGWTAAEAIGRSVDITFTPEDRANGVPGKEREEARDKGHAPDVRWHVRKDGSHVFIDGVSRPLTGPDGAVTGFVKVGQDVTERRATQEALRESEERFRQFGDASADVLWIRDAETLEFEYINPAFAEIYGMRREDLQTGNHVRRWVEAVHRDDRGISLDHLRRVRAGESLVNAFRILRRSDGEIRWIRDTGFPLLDADGRVQRLAGIGHDATEEVELNDRLRVLVAELQHRTRNLLAVVSAVARKTRAGSTSLDDFGARFETRLGALARVNSLLSRLENGHRIAFDELLQAELSAHGVIDADGHGSRVSLDGPKGVPLRSASVQTLALALHELTTNALKYGALSHAQGRLDVRWRLVSQDDHETRMRLTWEETGLAARAETDDRPVRRGYGRHLIEQALVHQLGAETHYELSSEGVRCIVDLPLSSTMEEAQKDIEEPDA
jgi:two-component system CheB/CheR fusion protein